MVEGNKHKHTHTHTHTHIQSERTAAGALTSLKHI